MYLMQYEFSHLSHIINLSSSLANVFSQIAHAAVSSLIFNADGVEVRCVFLFVLSPAIVDMLCFLNNFNFAISLVIPPITFL